MATGRVPTTANSPLTAKGDLFGYSTTQARVPVGSDGETLVADSSATTGLRYQPTKSTQNAIINGAYDIWQRGTSFTSSNVYAADRWFTYTAGTGATWSRQAGSGEFQYVMRMARNSGSTDLQQRHIWQSLAIEEATQFAGKTVTLSFYAKAGANYSGSGSAILLDLYSGTGSTDVNRVTAAYASGDTQVLNNQSFTITTTLTRYSVTFSLGSTVTQFGFGFKSQCSGTAGANDWVEITGVQLEVGSVATTFRRSGGTLAGELAACQRYFVSYGGNQNFEAIPGWGSSRSTTTHFLTVPFPQMRTTPSYSVSAVGNWEVVISGLTSQACTAITLSTTESGNCAAFLTATTAANANLGGDKPVRFSAANTTAARMFFSAEL